MNELTRPPFSNSRAIASGCRQAEHIARASSGDVMDVCRSIIDDNRVVYPQAEALKLARLLIADNDEAVAAMIKETLTGTSESKQLFAQLFSKTAGALGAFWERDQCSFADVTLGMSSLHRHLRENVYRLQQLLTPTKHHRRALITPIPGDDHIFASAMVVEYFRAAGWLVDSGINLKRSNLLRASRTYKFDFIGISVSAADRLYDASRLIHDFRSVQGLQTVPILVGGPPFQQDVTAAVQIGADYSASSALEAIEIATRLPLRMELN